MLPEVCLINCQSGEKRFLMKKKQKKNFFSIESARKMAGTIDQYTYNSRMMSSKHLNLVQFFDLTLMA